MERNVLATICLIKIEIFFFFWFLFLDSVGEGFRVVGWLRLSGARRERCPQTGAPAEPPPSCVCFRKPLGPSGSGSSDLAFPAVTPGTAPLRGCLKHTHRRWLLRGSLAPSPTWVHSCSLQNSVSWTQSRGVSPCR